MSFVHLHNHTQYSLLDGACRVDKMVSLAKKMGMTAVAMTDHGNMYGAVDFYLTCKEAGIKPIIGIEAYIIPGEYDDEGSKAKENQHHLVLLAKNKKGYRNLCKLSTISYHKGFYRKPRVTKSLLRQYGEGLICTTACIKGEIPSLLLRGKDDAAYKALQEYKEIFGSDLYIELQDHGLENEKKVMPKLIELAKNTETEMVVTNDCHYLHSDDAEAHDILMCIQTSRVETDTDRLKYRTDQLYFKSEEEMRKLFPELSEAYDNTVKITEQIDFELDYDNFLFPKMEIPEDYENSEIYLKTLCYDAIPQRYNEITPEIQKRLDYELQVINKMGFNDYFLIVRDFIKASRDMGIPVGPGRGSAAGSIVAYLLDITQIDPLKYRLLFERFLNLSRKEMPDIDIDFDSEGREKVIDYVVEKYGRESVCQIVTFGTLGAKTVVRDVGRVLEVPIPEVNKIAKLIPDELKMTLEKAYRKTPELRQLIESKPVYQRIFRIGKVLEGLIRQTGIHAAGVVIGPGDLSNYLPLALSTQKGNNPRSTLVQYEGKWLEYLKLLKMDFLGLKTLTLIRKTLELIEQNHNKKIDFEKMQLDDEKTYQLLSRAETDGVFQLESPGMKKYLRKLQPNRFDDIIAMVALYRPGPIQFIDDYIDRKHGKQEIRYSHPVMEKTLKETYGILVYQEQVMQVSKDLANFDNAKAGVLRKAMSKKIIPKMAELYVDFDKGARENGVKTQVIQQIWDDCKNFAEYAFNKSHAACYAYISYQTAYLKAHYPVEFMAALMSEEKDPGKIPKQIEVCKGLDIEVLPPDINISNVEFSVEGNKILYGLKGVKNVGAAAVTKIIEDRDENGKFDTIWNLCTRIDPKAVNKAVIESLIAAGALDCLEGNRAQKYDVVQKAIDFASSVYKEKMRGQITLFEEFAEGEESVMPQLPKLKDWDINQKLQKEKEVLGFFWSGHPLEDYKNIINSIINYRADLYKPENNSMPDPIIIAGLVNSVSKRISRRGKAYGIIEMEDLTGKYELGLFNDKYDHYIGKFSAGKKIIVIGRNNSQDGDSLRLVPDRIIELDKLISGNKFKFQILLEQKNLNEQLIELIENETDNKSTVNLEMIMETTDFSILACKTGRNIKISDKFIGKIKKITGQQPKLKQVR